MKTKTITLITLIVLLPLTIGAIEKDTFNLEVELPKKYLEITAGEKIFFTTKIINLDNERRKDIILRYIISEKETEVTSKRETVAIETQASFVGSIEIPAATKKGTYDLTVQIVDETNNPLSESGSSFSVIGKKSIVRYITANWKTSTLILAILLGGFLGFMFRNNIRTYIGRKQIHSNVKGIIAGKLKQGNISEKDLTDSHLPKKETPKKEDQIY